MKGLQWTIGEVEIFQIVEMEGGSLIQSIIPKATTKRIIEIPWLIPHFADKKGNLKALVQSFLIRSNGKNILIDTCNGNGKNRPETSEWSNLKTNFLRKLSEFGISETEIDVVACTHLHFDHIGWNTKLEEGKWAPTFPDAKYLFTKEEYDYWASKPDKEIVDDNNAFSDSVTPIMEAGLAKLVESDYRLDDHIRFISTPGHTPAHVSVVIESGNKQAIVSGDVFHHPCQIAHPEWMSFDTDPKKALSTRKKFLDDVVDMDTMVLGSHFANPVAGRVKREGKKFVFKV
jgi:glyoxylase-like metal-dependent hydrolase (beta-lactamase superfamily II)